MVRATIYGISLAGAAIFSLAFVADGPATLTRLGDLALKCELTGMATYLYRNAVNSSASLVPEHAYLELANLQQKPESLATLGDLAATGGRYHVATTLYKTAIERAGIHAPSNWIANLAAATSTYDPLAAAEIYKSAAARASVSDHERSKVLDYLEAALTLHEDHDLRWQLARLYVGYDNIKAENAFRYLASTRSPDSAAADYSLGMLLWDRGQINAAQTQLQQAALSPSFQGPLDEFLRWRRAREQSELNAEDEARRLAAMQQEKIELLRQHAALYQKLAKFTCDPRRFGSHWQAIDDTTLAVQCLGSAATALFVGLAPVFLMGELPIARLSEAGEAATLAGRIGMREAGAASALSAEESVAISAERILGEVEFRSTGEIEGSLSLRNERAIKTFALRYRTDLDAEEAAIERRIESVFSSQRDAVTTEAARVEKAANVLIGDGEAYRAVALVKLRQTKISLKLSSGFLGPEGLVVVPCRSDAHKADDQFQGCVAQQ